MVTLSELNGFGFKATNLRSFLFDCYRAREFYNPENKADILGLGVKYYYDKKLRVIMTECSMSMVKRMIYR